MDRLLASIRHNLSNLTRLEGRDANRQFWPWAIFVFVVAQIAWILALVPWMLDLFNRMFALGKSLDQQAGFPVEADLQIQATTHAMFEGLGDLWLPIGLIYLVAIGLLAAAVARRLHDRGKTGWWGMIPLPFTVVNVASMPLVAEGLASAQMNGLQLAGMLSGYLFWIALIILVVQLIGEGDKGANRYGPTPQPSV